MARGKRRGLDTSARRSARAFCRTALQVGAEDASPTAHVVNVAAPDFPPVHETLIGLTGNMKNDADQPFGLAD
jgi:hypothetical protein